MARSLRHRDSSRVSRRCSSAIMSREVKRSSPRPSWPSATSSGDAFAAAITWSYCSFPSCDGCTNIARSRVVKVACCTRDRVERDAGVGDDLLAIARARSRHAQRGARTSRPCSGPSAMPLARSCAAARGRSLGLRANDDRRAHRYRVRQAAALTCPAQRSRHCSSSAVAFQSRTLGPKPSSHDRPRRQHDMRMRLGETVGADVPMHVEVGDHPAIDELGFHEVAREPDGFGRIQLARNRELDLSGELRVLADLRRLDRIPQRLAICELLGCAVRQHHLGVDDARLVGEVVMALKPLVVQPRGGAIGGRRQGAGAIGAGDHLGREVVDRHDDHPSTLQKRTSARRISAPSNDFITLGTRSSVTSHSIYADRLLH